MGNRPVKDESSIEYYCEIEDPNVGRCNIYTARHLPSCFIMKIKTPIQNKYDAMAKIEDQQNRALITLYGYVRAKNCDCQQFQLQDVVISYWEYFNYYLKDLIESRALRQQPFETEEVWHFVRVCCQGYNALLKQHFLFNFQANLIVMSPEGKLKLFWPTIQDHNMHLPLLRHMSGDPTPCYYSPQELQLIRNKERSWTVDMQKCNVFSFGMLLLYLLTLINPIIFYHAYALDMEAIHKLIGRRVVGKYHPQIIRLLKSCLEGNPAARPTFKQVEEQLQQYMNSTYSIRRNFMENDSASISREGRRKKVSLRKLTK